MIRRLLIIALVSAAAWSQQVTQANHGIIYVGNEAQPVQPIHKSSIQKAIDLAGPTGTVIIPGDYPFPNETFTNPNNITVLDYRGKTLKIWGPGLEFSKGTNAILGYSAATNYYPNSATGTVCNKLVKLDGSGKAVVTTGGETSGIIGVAVAGCGTTGTVQVATSGQVPILFDAANVTVSDYVGISSGSGLVADSGASPGSGQNIGRIILKPDGSLPSSCNAAANCYVQLQLGSASGGGGGGCGGGGCVLIAPVGTQTITQPGGSQFVIVGGNFVVQAGGAVNGIFGPDSGTDAQTNGADNTFQLASGTAPGTQNLPPSGAGLPVWAPRFGGITYPSVLESQANKGTPGGYAGLNSNGQVDVAQLIAAAGIPGCSFGNFVRGDFSSCASATSNPPFSNILGGVNNGANAMICNSPCSLSGNLDAVTVHSVTYPDSGSLSGGLGLDNQLLQTVGPSNVSGVALPDCLGNNFLQHDNTLHTFPCNPPAGSLAPIMLKCNGTNGACPDATPFTGTAAVAILQSFSLPANTIATNRCMKVVANVQHPVGTASVTYSFNIGGTGARGAAPVGGVTTPSNYATTSTNNFQRIDVDFCNGGTAGNYYRFNQMQTGNGQVSGQVGTIGAVNWAVTNQINLTESVAITDQVAFNGGFVSF